MSDSRGGLPAPVWIAIAGGLALRIIFILATPVGDPALHGHLAAYNDERAHVRYIEYVRSTGTLPGHVEAITAPGALARGQFENYQPPLYYFIAAGLAALGSLSAPEAVTLLGRWLSCIFGCGLFFLFFLIARELNLRDSAVGAGLIFLALSGPLVRFTGTAGNESLNWLWCGWLLLFVLRMARAPLVPRDVIRLSLLLALGIWTKLSIIALLPLLFIAPLRRKSWPETGLVAAAICLATLLSLQLWVRNLREFGELIPLAAGFGDAQFSLPGLAALTFAVRSFVTPWWEFWRGGWDLLLMTPLLLLLIYSLIRLVRRSAVLAAALGLSALAFVWLNLHFRQAEGRYLLTAWPAVAVSVAAVSPTTLSLWLLLVALSLPYLTFVPNVLGG